MKDAPIIAARRIVAKFGGASVLARALSTIEGETLAPSTVQSWLNAGIPVKWHHPVILAGARAAVPIGPEDFFEPIVEPISPSPCAAPEMREPPSSEAAA